MTESAVVHSNALGSAEAARELCERLEDALPGGAPDALVVFASPSYEHPVLLRALQDALSPRALIGASSAGEFASGMRGSGRVCALALRSSAMAFHAGLGRGLAANRAGAARELVSSFRGLSQGPYAHRTALLFTDALSGETDDLVSQLTLATSGGYQFFGGAAGDDARFQKTSVFFGSEVLTDAVVGLEMLSHAPVGVGVGHGWGVASRLMRVTAAEGRRLISLNGLPALQVFEQHADETGQRFVLTGPDRFFLHNLLGIETATGHYLLRVPLAAKPDGSILFASEVPVGSKVHLMRTTVDAAVEATTWATRQALEALRGHPAQVALFFDCVASRLRMGEAFGQELGALAAQLGTAEYVGCNTHGQIVRAPGQFNGFHNCTAVVCVLPG
ncbi:FIST C-terminal domain-containing protein [Corallococcus sp. M34]|uniref:FIST signal transduction protein n=1 Tax=Citreicoccus inhibens TaxID=2849499 RepID=UPI001C235F45|nr:FIST N-terminal domain-containing protein [Citreicoccus inhibens]MBU8894658.1 FIST C-terminal domain-containing protein [Citreicoccus inhibens]